MLQTTTKNPGMPEAIKEVRIMSLIKTMRALYEGHMKQMRDQYARDEYVCTEGLRQGMEQVNRLNLRLIEDNRLEDLERAAKDRTYLEKLLKEYGIR